MFAHPLHILKSPSFCCEDSSGEQGQQLWAMQGAKQPPSILEKVLVRLLARLIPEDSKSGGHSHTNFCRSPAHQRVHERLVQFFQVQCVHIQHPDSDRHILVELKLPLPFAPPSGAALRELRESRGKMWEGGC